MTKLLMVLAASCVMGLVGASAQTSPTKPSSGDPAASSATTPPSNPSGSGTSTSGGMDANGDQGRDKMGTTGRASDKRQPSSEPSTPATGRQKSGTNAEGTAKP